MHALGNLPLPYNFFEQQRLLLRHGAGGPVAELVLERLVRLDGRFVEDPGHRRGFARYHSVASALAQYRAPLHPCGFWRCPCRPSSAGAFFTTLAVSGSTTWVALGVGSGAERILTGQKEHSGSQSIDLFQCHPTRPGNQHRLPGGLASRSGLRQVRNVPRRPFRGTNLGDREGQ